MSTSDQVIPLAEEQLSIEKRQVVTGKVRVRTETEVVTENLRFDLARDDVEVTRVRLDRVVSVAPPITTDGDVTIIPILEERLVVEKRLVLVEEIRISRRTASTPTNLPVTRRKQHAVVERLPQATQEKTEMSTIASSAQSANTLTAFFDSRADAQAAVDRLIAAGISAADVRMVEGDETAAGTTAAAAPAHAQKGFLESLADFFMPEEDRYSYAEGLRRGGYLVTVSGISADHYAAALDILDDEGAVDFGEREQQWRNEGWAGYSAAADTGQLDADLDTTTTTGAAGSGFAAASATTDSDVIPVVQEELRVGKRDVSVGRVRVRSYVVEEPVNQQVSLSSERVVLERRPVDRPLEAGDAAFATREIEAEEHAEEAVVAKTARVTEEVALRKEREERQETVSDTVRRTEVEVEDERDTTQRGTGTSGTTPSRKR